ncbi:hypothetical protein PCANC_28184, partial [Puccinia coronata f. sp. avenae]
MAPSRSGSSGSSNGSSCEIRLLLASAKDICEGYNAHLSVVAEILGGLGSHVPGFNTCAASGITSPKRFSSLESRASNVGMHPLDAVPILGQSRKFDGMEFDFPSNVV